MLLEEEHVRVYTRARYSSFHWHSMRVHRNFHVSVKFLSREKRTIISEKMSRTHRLFDGRRKMHNIYSSRCVKVENWSNFALEIYLSILSKLELQFTNDGYCFFLDAHERIRRSMRNEILSRSPCICSMNETERLTELLLHVYDCSRVSTRW